MHTVALSDFAAIVTDFDDTILDNKPQVPGEGMHERSRLYAIHTVGVLNGIEALATLPAAVNAVAFHNASVHSLEGALWWVFQQIRLVPQDAACDPTHPLIQQMILAKSESYRKLLATEAQEVPGAHRFFAKAYARGFADMLAIASTGHRADILSFSAAHGFSDFFPPEHIIAKEDTTNPKPDPESFQKAIESLGLSVADTPRVLAFEDDPRGIQAAKRLDMYTCAVTTRFSAGELTSLAVPPDMVARDFNEYVDIFGLGTKLG